MQRVTLIGAAHTRGNNLKGHDGVVCIDAQIHRIEVIARVAAAGAPFEHQLLRCLKCSDEKKKRGDAFGFARVALRGGRVAFHNLPKHLPQLDAPLLNQIACLILIGCLFRRACEKHHNSIKRCEGERVLSLAQRDGVHIDLVVPRSREESLGRLEQRHQILDIDESIIGLRDPDADRQREAMPHAFNRCGHVRAAAAQAVVRR